MLFETAHLGSYVVTTVLMYVAIAVGMMACVLPGIAASVLLAFAPMMVLEDGMKPMDALRASYEMVKPRFWVVLAVVLVLGLVGQIGSYACLVGVVVTMPIYMVALTYAYRALRGQTVA
jgi:uncharacterized membrane protein